MRVPSDSSTEGLEVQFGCIAYGQFEERLVPVANRVVSPNVLRAGLELV